MIHGSSSNVHVRWKVSVRQQLIVFYKKFQCLVDANYYYKNFRNYYIIYHKKDRFEYYISIGSASQGPYYVATFAEHLLVTRVGVRTSINRRIIDSVSFAIAILAGNNPYDGNKCDPLSENRPSGVVLQFHYACKLMGGAYFRHFR